MFDCKSMIRRLRELASVESKWAAFSGSARHHADNERCGTVVTCPNAARSPFNHFPSIFARLADANVLVFRSETVSKMLEKMGRRWRKGREKLQTLNEQWMSVKKVFMFSCTRQDHGIFIQFDFYKLPSSRQCSFVFHSSLTCFMPAFWWNEGVSFARSKRT